MKLTLEQARERVDRLRTALAAAERRLVKTALEHTGGSRRGAAHVLGWTERRLYRYLADHGDGLPAAPPNVPPQARSMTAPSCVSRGN